ncbi:MAG TPA: hypothetical protein VMA34_02130 [Terracidiphilus sp.]|nr:hypothetical protein [Terracidiphilus sp.]
MRVVSRAKDPRVRSYLELRTAVGWIALGLPWILLFGSVLLSSWLGLAPRPLPTSLSGFYYTPMRNVLVGSLCAIGFFNLCARGYEWRDEVAGFVSAVCALGLAVCPTIPPWGGTRLQQNMSTAHNYLAETFFITLATMCLWLFRTTAKDRPLTRNKRRRNTVYTACGSVMLACGVLDFFFHRMRPIPHFGPLGSIFCCELVALEAFGIAWLVKGNTFLADRRHPTPPRPASRPEQMAGV